jgi:guanylate kinase
MRPNDLPEIPEGKPLLVVISGPSGAGKDAVRDLLMTWDLPLHFAVTATNRAMRPGEVEGVDYLFVGDEGFDRMLRDGELVEHALVYGQKKGVPRSQVLEPLREGRDVIARVDVQGAETLRKLVPDALLVYIAAPSEEEAQRRLTGRDTEGDEDLRIRMETSHRENEAAKYFDHVIVNETDQIEMTARRVVEIIAEEKRRRAAAAASFA